MSQLVEVLAAEHDAFLSLDKSEAAAHLQQELFDLFQDRGFKILLRIGAAQAEEVQEVGIFENQIGCQLVFFS